MAQNQSLQDALAEATGLDDPTRAAFASAVARLDTVRNASESAARVRDLVALRQRQADSVLAAPGILVEVSARELPGGDFNACGFDPQNLLQVSPTVQMQTRWWRPCAGGVSSEFSVASVHDDEAGTVRAVIASRADLKLTIGGKPATLTAGLSLDRATEVKLESPRVNVDAKLARLSFDGRTLRITALPAD